MLDPGTFDGEVDGLRFSVSLPVGDFDMDIMKADHIGALQEGMTEEVDHLLS